MTQSIGVYTSRPVPEIVINGQPEEVGRDDYLLNDTGITSRNEFLRTGVRQKPEQSR